MLVILQPALMFTALFRCQHVPNYGSKLPACGANNLLAHLIILSQSCQKTCRCLTDTGSDTDMMLFTHSTHAVTGFRHPKDTIWTRWDVRDKHQIVPSLQPLAQIRFHATRIPCANISHIYHTGSSSRSFSLHGHVQALFKYGELTFEQGSGKFR